MTFDIEVYQLCDDAHLKSRRSDGNGWDLGWANYERQWMNDSGSRFAYRCLPLTIANQVGFWVTNPIGFYAEWNGSPAPGSVSFHFDPGVNEEEMKVWRTWITNHFGGGIVTWNTPFLFRTRPQGSRLIVTGPTNLFKVGAQPLTAIMETDWMTMSFTMNWKLLQPWQPVRFSPGEPIFQAIPLRTNVIADLEGSKCSYQKLGSNQEIEGKYLEWAHSRDQFHKDKDAGLVRQGEWQKDYFKGHQYGETRIQPEHSTRVRHPKMEHRDGQ